MRGCAGTSLSLSRIFLSEAQKKKKKKNDEGWWFDLKLNEAIIDVTEGTRVDTSTEFSMRDIKPVVALLKEEGKSPKWFGMMPNVKDVDGYLEVDLDPGELDIQNLDINGKSLKFLGRLDSDQDVKRAAFYAKYKGVAVGISMDSSREKKKKQWRLVNRYGNQIKN